MSEVLPDSPASKAGIVAGDVIIKFDGKLVDSSSALPVLVSLTESGKSVGVELWRNGRAQTVNVRLEAKPGRQAAAGSGERESGGFGLQLRPFTPGLRQELGVDISAGVLVAEVAPGSPAARAGLRPGDVVTDVNGKGVSEPGELVRVLRELKPGQVARLKIARGSGKLFVALEKSERK